jgi:hypothetical protein
VYAEGEIVNGQGSGQQVGGDRFARQLRQLRQDEDVKAVVLRINSPGGSVTASEEIQREVRLTVRRSQLLSQWAIMLPLGAIGLLRVLIIFLQNRIRSRVPSAFSVYSLMSKSWLTQWHHLGCCKNGSLC